MKPAAALVLLAAACAYAQPREPNPAAPTPAEVEQVAPTPKTAAALDLPETIDAALAHAREVYRTGPISERIQITLTTADEQRRTTSVLLRVDAGAQGARPRDRRLWLDLGRLQIAADDTAITALAPREPALYFQSPVTAPLSLDQLWNAVPPVPLPQLEWALSDDAHRLGRVITAVLQTSWLTVQHTQRLGTIFQGQAPGGTAIAEFSSDGRLVLLSVPLSKDGDRIELRVTQEGLPDVWTLSTEGRKAVPSIADLRGRPADVIPGSRLPALSLMTRDLDAWSLQDELDRAPSRELARVPAFGLLIAYRPAGPTAQQDAELGARAVSIARTDISHSQPDPTRRPRLVPVVIAMLDLPDMNREKLVALDSHWSNTLPDAPPRYFSPTGAAELDRLANGSRAAVIIVDSTQKVLAAISLESRPDAESLAQELESVIESGMRISEPP